MNTMSRGTILTISLLCWLTSCKTGDQAPPKQTAAPPANSASRFGIAVQSSGRVCLSIADPNLPPGAVVKLIYAEHPQTTADATVVGPASTCPAAGEDHPSPYELKVTQGKVADNVEGIAVAGPATFSAADDTVTGHLDPGSQTVTFRSCESSEGVHLTVWSGAALQGPRLWHGYHHLDYGVEANCTPKDTEP